MHKKWVQWSVLFNFDFFFYYANYCVAYGIIEEHFLKNRNLHNFFTPLKSFCRKLLNLFGRQIVINSDKILNR